MNARMLLTSVLSIVLTLSMSASVAEEAPVCAPTPDGIVAMADPGLRADPEHAQTCSFTATGPLEFTSTAPFAWSISIHRGGRSWTEVSCTPVFPGTCNVPTTGVLATRAGDRVTITLHANCLVREFTGAGAGPGPCWLGFIALSS